MTKYYYTYFVLLTEGSLKGKVYFGKRCTNNLNENYIGSGKILRDYLKTYPDGYYREIIKFYNTKEELSEAEYELIHPHLGKDYCINLKEGGDGVCSYLITEETREKMREGHKRNNVWLGKNHTDKTRKKQSESRKKYLEEHPEEKKTPAWKGVKGKSGPIGKHRVYDNKELKIYHYE